MSSHGNYPERIPGLPETRLAWLVALVAGGLVLVAGALALDLHNQKRRLEYVSAQLKGTYAMREAENKSLGARSRVGELALNRLNELQAEQEADLKTLGEAYTQREPLVKQSAELQGKLQALVNDLLDLAKTDQDAREIVRKYSIQQKSPTSGAGAARP